MATLLKSHDLFGEEWSGYEVHTFPVKDGQGYYISHEVDNTRTVFTQHEILIRYEDGQECRTYVDTPEELKLWTEHLQ